MTDLEQYREIANRAYSGISFFPDKCGDKDLKDLESHLLAVKEEIEKSQLADEKKTSLYDWYEKKIINLQIETWCAKSRCLSSMIAGPAKFPTKRATAALNRTNKIEMKLLQFWLYDISKLIVKNLPDEIKASLKIEADIKAIDYHVNDCITNAHSYVRPYFQKKIENLINSKKLIAAEYAINKAKEHKIFTERNRIFKLFEEMKVKLSAPQEKPQNKEYQINGVRVLENTEIDRLQIFFDGKPDSETIAKLKAKAWHWSPRNMAWQRQLTPNAKSSLSYIFTTPAN